MIVTTRGAVDVDVPLTNGIEATAKWCGPDAPMLASS
jgi:hypothetical protein